MSARPSWSLDDINPKVRERAEDSARRAGMTMTEWLNATIGDAASSVGRSPFDLRETGPDAPRPAMTAQERLDAYTRSPEFIAPIGERPAAAPPPEPPRGEARLSDFAEPSVAGRAPIDYGPRSSGALSLEAAVAEITARQRELEINPLPDPRSLISSTKLSKLERQISHIMQQMETLPSSGQIEQSIASFRSELTEIRQAITDALPRTAIESLENEVRTLAGRLDETRERGVDAPALAGVESGLDQIRASLRNMMSAEQLAGFDEAIRNLSAQLESVVKGGKDPAVLNQLEEAIAALRVIVSKVASNEALENLGGDVRSLAAKLDEFANSGGFGESIAALETRIVSLASYLQRRETAPAAARHDDPALDSRMSKLLERMETIHADPAIERLEEGLRDIRVQLEQRRSEAEQAGDPQRGAFDDSTMDAIKRDLADMRMNLMASDRHTMESLEAVNSTLAHVVDRLAMIEGDLRAGLMQPPASHTAVSAPMPPPPPVNPPPPAASAPLPPRPEIPNPAADRPLHETEAPPLAPRAMLAPDLPPDTPLEPGTRTIARGVNEADDDQPESVREGTSSSSFIAAARRAARVAAASAPDADKGKVLKKPAEGESTLASKIRSLLVGASVVVIVIGSFRMAMTLIDSMAPAEQPAASSSAPADTTVGKQSAVLAPAPKPDPIFNPTLLTPPPSEITGSISGQAGTEPPSEQMPAVSRSDAPGSETLPEAIGPARLREAALRGDAGAAYEVALRFAEARGVSANYAEAARWYERAAQAGIAPAAFRLGAMYEKGFGVKKDIDAARRYYTQAAERGNAKAMHNLAVLEADGGGTAPNFKAASHWFRKAAERGVVDSQYNLGILYARGIGLEQNLAESYKWFSLAAAQGDADSGSKRDEVAKKIDPQSLAAAKLAIQTFTPEPQPPEATNVAAPVGGWDNAAVQSSTQPKPATRKAAAAAPR